MLIPLLKSFYICIFMLIPKILTLPPLKFNFEVLVYYYKIYFRVVPLKFEDKSFLFIDNTSL